MPLKREPDAFPAEGPGGARHRYDDMSKADWADAYADLYRSFVGPIANAEEILGDAEMRDDRRILVAGKRPRKRPRPATEAEKAAYHAKVAEARRLREEWRAAHPEGRA